MGGSEPIRLAGVNGEPLTQVREVRSPQLGLSRAERRAGASLRRKLEAMGHINIPYRKEQRS